LGRDDLYADRARRPRARCRRSPQLGDRVPARGPRHEHFERGRARLPRLTDHYQRDERVRGSRARADDRYAPTTRRRASLRDRREVPGPIAAATWSAA
jgi:hypothetical protein